MDGILGELKDTDLLREDDGALVVDLDEGFKKPCLIQH